MANTNQKRFRAKVENFGFRNQHWQAGQIVEVSAEEAEIIPHHFEELGKAADGSDEKEINEKIQEQEKLDTIRDRRARETYDEVRPAPAGGPAVPIERKPEDIAKDAAARKAEEVENDKRREELRKNPRR